MFACAVYDLTPEFEANIKEEFKDNLKRIRHHASLGLMCGNNEMEQFVKEGNWVSKASEVRDYIIMYERILPQMMKQYAPQVYYWPASPSSGGSFDDPRDENRGDVHYWDVWHGNKPFSEYRKFYFRYLSEFGFQSFPSRKTIETFTDDERDMNIFSYIMERHQRNGSANESMQDQEVTVKWQVRDAAAHVLRMEEETLHVSARTSVWMDKVDLPEIDIYSQYVSYQAFIDDLVVSDGTVIFSYPKYFRYENPNLRAYVDGNEITVYADNYAKSIEILNDNEDLILSDNYFDLNAGSKTVKVIQGNIDHIRLRSVYDI